MGEEVRKLGDLISHRRVSLCHKYTHTDTCQHTEAHTVLQANTFSPAQTGTVTAPALQVHRNANPVPPHHPNPIPCSSYLLLWDKLLQNLVASNNNYVIIAGDYVGQEYRLGSAV